MCQFAAQGVGSRFAETYNLVLPVVAFVGAATTSYFLDNIPTAWWRWLPLTFGVSAPVLRIAAPFAPGPLSFTLLKVQPGEGGPGTRGWTTVFMRFS